MLRSGLIGRAIQDSRSPWLHEQEARAQGLELSYELFDFSERGWPDTALGALLPELRDKGYAGVNVTYPFKQAVMPLLVISSSTIHSPACVTDARAVEIALPTAPAGPRA